MITVIAAGCVWAALWIWIIKSEGWPDDAVLWVLGALVVGVTFIAALGAGAWLASFIGSELPGDRDKAPSHVATLIALRSSDGIDGTFRGGFFLGIGHIGTQLYYFWYEEEAGGVTPRQLQAGKGTYVYESDRKTAEVRVFDWHFKKSWWTWFASEEFGQTWEFHVPKGTVKQGYSL